LAFLEIHNLTKRFMGLVALDDINIQIEQGELVALIGPNGSGKSTLFNCITGFLRPEQGRVHYQGRDITGLPPHKIALLGLSRTFQLATVFPKLTLLENLELAVQQRQEESLVGRFVNSGAVRQYEQDAVKRADEILELIELKQLRDEPASCLGYGQLKLFVFGMALMPDPQFLMLDEPSAATDPTMVRKIKQQVVALNKEGKTVLFVEHDMKVVMDIAQRIIVLDYGKIIAEGLPREIQNNQKVIEAYFGRQAARA